MIPQINRAIGVLASDLQFFLNKTLKMFNTNEASYFHQINMTKNRLEYDRKIITPMIILVIIILRGWLS